MKKTDTFADRRQEAEAARMRRLEKFKAQTDLNSPEAQARALARQAEKADKAARKAAADLEKRMIAERARAEATAAAAASRAAEGEARVKAAEAKAAQEILDEAARKAKRDARYASRKARS